MHSTTQTPTVPATILQQLGGRRFIAMTGATCYNDGEFTLLVKFKGSRIANIMYVTLNAMDTYDVRICKFKGTDVKEVATLEGAYDDMLRPFFEKTTGLRTSL